MANPVVTGRSTAAAALAAISFAFLNTGCQPSSEDKFISAANSFDEIHRALTEGISPAWNRDRFDRHIDDLHSALDAINADGFPADLDVSPPVSTNPDSLMKLSLAKGRESQQQMLAFIFEGDTLRAVGAANEMYYHGATAIILASR